MGTPGMKKDGKRPPHQLFPASIEAITWTRLVSDIHEAVLLSFTTLMAAWSYPLPFFPHPLPLLLGVSACRNLRPMTSASPPPLPGH